MLNLEVFNGMAVGQDLGQQRPQLGDVPLTVAQVVDEPALRLFFRGVEVPVEGGVGRANPQALVENHEWLSQGRDDVLSVGQGEFQLMCTIVIVCCHVFAPRFISLSFVRLPVIRRLCQGEEHDLFSGDGADVVVQAQHLDACDLLNHRFHDRPSRFDQMSPYSFE